MYRILLLREDINTYSRVKDYLQISNCIVEEDSLESLPRYRIQAEKYDLILLDCDQLERHYTDCRRMRAWTQLPVVVVSKCWDEWSKVRMLQAGADDYVVKPCQAGELAARVHSHIYRYRRLTQPLSIIQSKELVIDPYARKVMVGGEEIYMRPKEFDILVYMAQNSGKAVTKEELYHAVWRDENGGPYLNSVAVHVKRIREKIEENPDSPYYIETVWGIGYRFHGD